MLNAVQGWELGYIICGVIWAIAVGFAIGNYACSLVHRLPRGRLILDKKPYCGNCGEQLQVRDLFPVFSALSLHHKCRYCGVGFPTSHTWTEILVGLLFVLCFLQYSFSEQFLLIACIGVFLITLAAIHANENMVMGKILTCIIISGIVYRTLIDHSIYDAFLGGLLGLVIGCVLWRKDIKPVAHIFIPPVPAQLLAVGGICVGLKLLPLFFAAFLLLFVFFWLIGRLTSRTIPLTVPFGFAVMLPVLYPKLMMLILG